MRTAWLLALIPLTACGGDDAADPVFRETITETKTLIGSEVAEATLEGGPDDKAVLRITANAAELDWNIHGHVDEQTMTFAEGLQVTTVDEEFVPPAAEHYSVLVRNHSAVDMLEITLEVDLYGDMEWETFGEHDD
jgi:hypothetical protein